MHAAVSQSPLVVEVVGDDEGFRRLQPEWDALHGATATKNPFTQWVWVWHWWQILGRKRGLVRDQLQILVVRNDESEVTAIVPLVLTKFGLGPLVVRALRLYGFGGSFTELRAPLIRPGWEEVVAKTLVLAFGQWRKHYDWVVLDGILQTALVSQVLRQQTRTLDGRWTKSLINYVLPLPQTWDELRSRFGRNMKENLRHCYNSLKREGHTWTFEVVSSPAAIPIALEEFFTLHAARAALPARQRHPDHFAAPLNKAFLRRITYDMATMGQCIVCRLRINDRVVATRLAFQLDDSLYLYYSGFDPAWASYSVMTTLTAECVKMAIDKGYRTVSLSPGTDASKLRWKPQAQLYEQFMLVPPTFKARLLNWLYTQQFQLRHGTPPSPQAVAACSRRD